MCRGQRREVPRLRLALLLGCAGCVGPAPLLDGPMAVRNLHPAQLLVQSLTPRGAGTTPPGAFEARLSTDYTSLFLSDFEEDREFVMDGEVLRAAVVVRTGLAEDLDLEIELPALYGSGGFLDEIIIDFHKLFGFNDLGREDVENDLFDVHASRLGVTGYELEQNRFALADLPITAQWCVLRPDWDRIGLALRSGIEIPTGDADDGFGNGSLDASLGLVLELRALGCGFTLGASHTWTGSSSQAERAGIEFRDVTSGHLGVEVPLLEGFHLLLQTTAESSTLRSMHLSRTDRVQVLGWVGARVRLSDKVRLEGGFAEDLSPNVSPDFTARLAVSVRLP